MPRPIEHSAFVHRSFDDVCWILTRHADEVFETASDAASRRSVALVDAADLLLPGYDGGEDLQIQSSPFASDRNHASVELHWDANAIKRLLANVDMRLDIRPLVRSGPRATTELVLRSRYVPHVSNRRSPETALFGRRVVSASLHRFLESLVVSLDDYEENILVLPR